MRKALSAIILIITIATNSFAGWGDYGGYVFGTGFGNYEPVSPITDLFNGFDSRGSFVGGPTRVADNLGALTTSPANVLAVQGGRLSYSLEEGATLGPELVGDPSFDTGVGWTLSAAATIADGQLNIPDTQGEYALRGLVYPSTMVSVTWSGTGTVELREDTGPYTQYTLPSTRVFSGVGKSRVQVANTLGSSTASSISSVSVREIIPIWLPTAANGSPLWPSQSVRTRKGSVAKFDSTYLGPLNEPARTQLLFPSAAPVIQNITTTAQQYTISCIGSGSLTVSGSAIGVATQASPLTVTAIAGTLIVTPTGTLTHGQVEAGAFKTSPITSVTGTVTRPASNYTRPTAGVLRANDWGIWGRVVPSHSNGSLSLLTYFYTNASNRSGVGTNPTNVNIYKVIAGAVHSIAFDYTIVAGVPFEYQAFQSSAYGMGIRVKADGGAWQAWALKNDAGGKASTELSSTMQLGAANSATHFAGNFPFTAIIQHSDPKAELERLAARYP